MPPAPSIANSVTVRLILPARATAVSEMTGVIEAAGGVVTGLDVTASGASQIRIDLTMLTHDPEHAEAIVERMREVEGVEIGRVSDRTFLLHLGGKLSVESKVPIRSRDDLSMIYTPGVARVCLAIAENPEDARRLTIKRNTVAVVTDGTAVLGLGNIGPLAALPVMEGKAALFKRFADIDAFPICLDTTDTEEIIRTVKAISPVFAGINLEDISAPRCFEIEARLREELDIPVFHDDQHGTAIVALAALRNALRVVGKRLEDVRLVMSGAGAAGTAILKLFLAGRGAARRRRRRRRDRAPRAGRRAVGGAPEPRLDRRAHEPRRGHRHAVRRDARRRRVPRRLGAEHPHRGRHRVDGARQRGVRHGQPGAGDRPGHRGPARRRRGHRVARTSRTRSTTCSSSPACSAG